MTDDDDGRRAARAKRRAKHMRDVARAAERMAALIQILAPNGCCAKCGKVPRTESLQVHHVDGRDWEPRRVNQWTRAKRYLLEHAAGVRLQALCIQCNAGINPKRGIQTARNRLNRSVGGRT